MTKNTLLALIGLIILLGLFGYVYSQRADLPDDEISNFSECVEAGNPVMESFPRQCTANGVTYTETVVTPDPDEDEDEDEDEQPTPDPDTDNGNDEDEEDVSDLIRVTAPVANAEVDSPLTITGDARGTWYFEASFPVKLYDANGKLLASHYATAQGEWMTENFVPFTSTITFATPTTATGTLVLEKDNPSGLPEHDNSITIPVRFDI
jgi:hypothetical protein